MVFYEAAAILRESTSLAEKTTTMGEGTEREDKDREKWWRAGDRAFEEGRSEK